MEEHEAREDLDAAVVMHGDSGGQVYLTCPVRLVRCSEDALRRLLVDLDALGWRAPEDAMLTYQRLPVGSGVWGGMGGGVVVDGVWLHPELEAPELRRRVEAVLAGARDAIDPAGANEVVFEGRVGVERIDRPAKPLPALAERFLDDLAALLALRRPRLLDAASPIRVFGFGACQLHLGHVEERQHGVAIDLWPEELRVTVGPDPYPAELDFRADEAAQAVALIDALLRGRAAIHFDGAGDDIDRVVVRYLDDAGDEVLLMDPAATYTGLPPERVRLRDFGCAIG